MRTRTRRWLAVAGIAGVLVLTASWWLGARGRRPQPALPPAAMESAPDPTDVPRRAERRMAGSRAPAVDLPAADMPASAAIDALLPLAQAGRADAMHELALRLMYCARAPVGSDEEIRTGALKHFYANNGHEPSSDDDIATVASNVDAFMRRRDECAGVDADLSGRRVGWLEKAARAGDTQAQLDFARYGLHDMGRDDILMQPDEVQRRREVAGDELQRALAAGDCGALDLLAQAYSGRKGRLDWIYPPDPTLSAAYAAAARLRSGEADARADAAAASLDAVQHAASERQGAALYARYCGGSGG